MQKDADIVHVYVYNNICIYEDVNYPFEDDVYIRNCVEHHKGPCGKLFTKVHQFDLILTETEIMTDVTLCRLMSKHQNKFRN